MNLNINLNLKEILNCTSLEESLQQSTLPEKLEGSNQITLQSGLKSNGTCQTLFSKLPEVCFFQLKRFIYNPQSHTIQKVVFEMIHSIE